MGLTASSGKYFVENSRVWEEAIETGCAPAWFGHLYNSLRFDQAPTPLWLQCLFVGEGILPHVQGNRVNAFDWTLTWSKSVSIWAYGMRPPEQWGQAAAVLNAINGQILGEILRSFQVNVGSQGKAKAPAHGVAAAFSHWKSWGGEIHAHHHNPIPNIAATSDGQLKSIANARDVLYRKQGEYRAKANKLLDDRFQAIGLATKRVGSAVELANLPTEVVRELSSAKAAMEEARYRTGFDSPRAQEFYARQMRRDRPCGQDVTPQQAFEYCQKVLREHRVTLETLKKAPSREGSQNAAAEKHVAFQAATAAIAEVSKKHPLFSLTQFREALFLQGIGRPVRFEVLDRLAQDIAKEPERFTLKTVEVNGKTRYGTKESIAGLRRDERKEYLRESWDSFKASARQLPKAVAIATVKRAKKAVDRLLERWNPELKRQSIDVANLDKFLEKHYRRSRLKCHAIALWRGFWAPGNPHDKALVAEREYARLREYSRVYRGTVLVVEDSHAASPRQLRALSRIQDRDKFAVILSERPDLGIEKEMGRNGMGR